MSRLLRAAPILALLAPLLVVLPGAPASSAAGFAVVLAPAAQGDTAVRAGQQVRVSGDVPTGELVAARLVAVAADGSEQVQPVPASALGADGADGGDFLRVQDGSVTGRLSLLCVFGPQPDCSPESPAPRELARRALLELTVGGVLGRSNALRVDLDRPRVRDAWLAGPQAVVVRFTEPVRQPDLQSDAAGDWRVSAPDAAVVAVDGPTPGDCTGGYGPLEDPAAGDTGCTRTLRLATALDEDDPPVVDYVLFDDRFPGRQVYEDFSSSALIYTGTATTAAVDRVRPPTPRIDRVDGTAPPGSGRLDARRSAPVLDVSNLRAGSTAFVRVTPHGGSATDGPPVSATGATAALAVPELPTDGSYLLEVLARDPAGNLSSDDLPAARADGSPSRLTYVLDTTAPRLVQALTDASTVRLTLSEPVAGSDAAADYRVTGPGGTPYPVTAVTATEDRSGRVLSVAGVPVDSTVRYAPAATSTRYSDPAGNVLPDSELTVRGVPVPVVGEPVTARWTNAAGVPVRGTSRSGTVVSVHRDAGDDGTPDGPALVSASVPAGGSGFDVVVPLTASARNDLVVLATDPDTGLRSGAAALPPVVQDSTDPTLTLTSPTAGQLFAGGAPVTIRYSTCDSFAPAGPVGIEYAADGSSFAPVAAAVGPGCTEDGAYDWTAPRTSTTAGRLRLTATDLAGNDAVVVSAPFSVDAVAPTFMATTRTPREVVVRFAEPVSGPLRAADWTVAGRHVGSLSSDGSPGSLPDSVTGLRTVTLTLGVTAPDLGVDERPVVAYAPPPLLGELADPAGQGVASSDRAVEALDGIVPAAPTVSEPPQGTLVGDPQVTVTGGAEPGTTIVASEAGPRRAEAPVPGSGTFSVVVPLQADRANALELRAVDGNGNASSPALLTVVQDSSPPVVGVTAPAAGSRYEPGSAVTVRWSLTDARLAERPVSLDMSTDGGQTFAPVAGGLVDTGSYTWQVPQATTSRAVVRVRAVDWFGRVGSGSSGWFGIGQSADASPTPSPAPTSPTPSPGDVGTGTFHPLSPARLIDTRSSSGPVAAARSLRVPVLGRAGVPTTGVSAVVVNVTAVAPTAASHLTVWPAGQARPLASTLNFPAGRTVANAATLPLGADGSIEVANAVGAVHLVVDVFGWYADASGAPGVGFAAVSPARLLDTRSGLGAARGPLGVGQQLELQVAGRGGVPLSGATAVVLTVTAVAPTVGSHLTLAAAGARRPETSNVNFPAGATTANLVTVPVGRDGKVSVLNALGQVHVVADVFGWYGTAAPDVFVPTTPRRLLDTRSSGTRLAGGQSLRLPVAGGQGVPEGATAALLNLTAVDPTSATHITAYPADGAPPDSSNLNAPARRNVAALAAVRLSVDGAVLLRNAAGEVHIVVDLAGYFARR